jgi:hypothetical protein
MRQQVADFVSAMRADLFELDCDFYPAGSQEFVSTLRDELRGAGVAQAQIFAGIV